MITTLEVRSTVKQLHDIQFKLHLIDDALVEIRDHYIEGEAGRRVALSVTNLEQSMLWLKSAEEELRRSLGQK